MSSRADHPEDWKQEARQVLAEFMDELPSPGSRFPGEEIVRLSSEIYDRDIRHQLVADHHGEVVAIDVVSERWAVARDEMTAECLLRKKEPDAVNILCERVGYRTLRSFGGGSLRRTR